MIKCKQGINVNCYNCFIIFVVNSFAKLQKLPGLDFFNIQTFFKIINGFVSNFSSDPCQLKSTTAQSVDDVIEIPPDKSKTAKTEPPIIKNKMDVTPTIHEVEVEDEDDDIMNEPQQKAFRRGGVSAEAIKEDELNDYEKKVCRCLHMDDQS